MNVKKHCDLCEHQILSLKEGTICGLTNKKPVFNNVCLNVNFSEKLKKRLEDLHIDLEIEKKARNEIISSFIFNLVFGLVLIIGGSLFFQSMLNKGVSATYSRGIVFSIGIIIPVGLYLFKKPFLELASINKEIKIYKKELFVIQEVLNLYSVTYKYDIEILKEVHGTQEYSFDIEIIKN